MPYQIYLVNHTRLEYVKVCQSGFSQERTLFMIPDSWSGSEDDMEMMTEFVFREKLKHRKRYDMIEMFPEPESEDTEENTDQEDISENIRQICIQDKTQETHDEGDDEGDDNEGDDEEGDLEELII